MVISFYIFAHLTQITERTASEDLCPPMAVRSVIVNLCEKLIYKIGGHF